MASKTQKWTGPLSKKFLEELNKIESNFTKFWIADLLEYSENEIDPHCENGEKHCKC